MGTICQRPRLEVPYSHEGQKKRSEFCARVFADKLYGPCRVGPCKVGSICQWPRLSEALVRGSMFSRRAKKSRQSLRREAIHSRRPVLSARERKFNARASSIWSESVGQRINASSRPVGQRERELATSW